MKLIKTIRSRGGALHFQRFALLETPWFNIYLHKIYRPDEDGYLHDHPWDFQSLILEGSYTEQNEEGFFPKKPFMMASYKAEYVHKIAAVKRTTLSLVITGPRRRVWGYQTPEGWMDNKTFRKWKHERKDKTNSV